MDNEHAESNVAVQIDHATEILEALKIAYNMEMETVMNYVSNSINLDGVRAKEIKESLEDDITAELEHARRLGRRIHILGGTVPGSQELKFDQASLQPRKDSADLVSVINGVIEAEEAACEHYRKLIDICDGVDFVTQELCIELLGDEEEHRREFQGYLKEFERGR
ncbi:MAG TPA: ferritin-like domain-containing protein [Planctomycetota bacterium]|nr:ferritin-like domain-containing protein [Planctomycetota bacterium]